MAGKFLTGKLGEDWEGGRGKEEEKEEKGKKKEKEEEMERIEKEGVGNYTALTFCSNSISQAVAR